MQEFTRIIGSIHRTGIDSIFSVLVYHLLIVLFLEYFIKTREGTIKERDEGE